MKKITILSVGIILTLALSWIYQSGGEFYEAGQQNSLWFYIQDITTDKLVGCLTTLILGVIIYFFSYKEYKKSKTK